MMGNKNNGWQALDNRTGRKITEFSKLAGINASIYWYPGSGDDLVPVLLDRPDNFTGRRLWNGSSISTNDVVLWMNDYSDCEPWFLQPTDQYVVPESYQEIWKRFHGKIRIESVTQFNFDVFGSDAKHWLIQASISRRLYGASRVVFIFSKIESEHLIKYVFLKLGFTIHCIALISQAGFGQREGRQQYSFIPKLIERALHYGFELPSAYIADQQFKTPLGYSLDKDHLVEGWGHGAAYWIPKHPT